MAYDTTQLRLVTGALTSSGPQLWEYDDTVASGTVIATGYISDGDKKKMRVGDLVIYRRFTELVLKNSITSVNFCVVTAVAAGVGVTLSSPIDGTATAQYVLSGTVDPTVATDNTVGAAVGTVYVNTTNGVPFLCINAGTGVAMWVSLLHEVMFEWNAYTVVTAAGNPIARFVAPFTGRITQFRAITNGTLTGTAKKVYCVISGVTVLTSLLSLTHGSVANTKFASAPTTGNKIAAGMTIALQSGAQAESGASVNFFVVCRRVTTN
jgi:hypothetical protein